MIDFFVFSWKRVLRNAYKQFDIIRRINQNTYFLNCDPRLRIKNVFNLDDIYYGEQFDFVARTFNNEILGILAGDAYSSEWNQIFNTTIQYFKTNPNIGILAPSCTLQPHQKKKERYDKNTFFVENTDCTAWFINRKLINIFNTIGVKWKENKYGWGIDQLLCETARKLNMPVLVNFDHLVEHPWSYDGSKTGYNPEDAKKMLEVFVKRYRHFPLF